MALDFRYLRAEPARLPPPRPAPPPAPPPGVSPGCRGSLGAAWDWQRGARNLHRKAGPVRTRDRARLTLQKPRQETETSSEGCAASSSSAFTPALCPRSFSSLPVSRVQGFLSRQQLQGCWIRLGRIGLAHVPFLLPPSPQCQTHCSLDPFHWRESPGAIALDQEVKIGMDWKRKRRHHVLLIAREASLVSLAPMLPLPGFPSW
ncbi:unnamed protein product [Nyctereutes procyonoides]|uniref:(raccoon dog) hypothetical protein n=1 Tax=Nyctereutes procyonoides TaxID=34880 RepID=A0A811ZYK8_NYCPR|nr:unnamed protein product [Nyctereutes procyonoides]